MIMVIVPSRREWGEKFWIKYCLRCWAVLQDSWFVECADRTFQDWFDRCYPQMNVWLKLTMDDFVYVFDAWRKWSCGVVCVWPRTNSDTIVSMFIWFSYMEWMIYGNVVVQFYPWFKFYFPLFQIHYQTLQYPKTKGNEIWTKNKIELQQR